MDRLQATPRTIFESDSHSSSPAAVEFNCASAQSIEVFVNVTAGGGSVVVALLTAPDKDGPFRQVDVTSSLSSGAGDVLGVARGAGVGGRARITATVTGTVTFEVRASVWE